MDGESNMFLWVSAGLCLIIIVIISIFNFFRISNLETETDNLQISLRKETDSDIQKVLEEDNSNIKKEIVEIKKEMESNIDSNVQYIVENQRLIDSNQNFLIDKNELDIFNIGSNITHVIEPQILVFDGKFKSLEGNIRTNDASIDELSKHIAAQFDINAQFSNQYDSLSNDLYDIVEKDFGGQIQTINADIGSNSQSISDLNVKYQSLSNMNYTLLQSNIEIARNLELLSATSLDLADFVDLSVFVDVDDTL